MRTKTLESVLSDKFTEELGEIKKKYNVEDALKKALDDTTPEHGGLPWKNKRPEPKVESEWFDN